MKRVSRFSCVHIYLWHFGMKTYKIYIWQGLRYVFMMSATLRKALDHDSHTSMHSHIRDHFHIHLNPTGYTIDLIFLNTLPTESQHPLTTHTHPSPKQMILYIVQVIRSSIHFIILWSRLCITVFSRRHVLRLHEADGFGDMGSISLKNAACLVVAWLIIFACIMKGIKTSGKVWFLAANKIMESSSRLAFWRFICLGIPLKNPSTRVIIYMGVTYRTF